MTGKGATGEREEGVEVEVARGRGGREAGKEGGAKRDRCSVLLPASERAKHWFADTPAQLLFPLERSNDIDIALDTLSGSAGVEVLGEYCTARDVECGKIVLKSHGRVCRSLMVLWTRDCAGTACMGCSV